MGVFRHYQYQGIPDLGPLNVANTTLLYWAESGGLDTTLQQTGFSAWTPVPALPGQPTNAIIRPLDGGAFLLQVPDGTVIGGNTRGESAVDLQMARDSPTEVASGAFSFAAGFGNTAMGDFSVAMGSDNISSGEYATSFGNENTVSNASGFAAGAGNIVNGIRAAAFGTTNQANGDGSFVCGSNNDVSGADAFASGIGHDISGNYSHAEGQNHTITGPSGHGEGENHVISATCAHGEGFGHNVSGPYGHGEGASNIVTGFYSHAQGYQTTATGSAAHAGGYGVAANTIVSSGTASFVHGYAASFSESVTCAAVAGAVFGQDLQQTSTLNNAGSVLMGQHGTNTPSFVQPGPITTTFVGPTLQQAYGSAGGSSSSRSIGNMMGFTAQGTGSAPPVGVIATTGQFLSGGGPSFLMEWTQRQMEIWEQQRSLDPYAHVGRFVQIEQDSSIATQTENVVGVSSHMDSTYVGSVAGSDTLGWAHAHALEHIGLGIRKFTPSNKSAVMSVLQQFDIHLPDQSQAIRDTCASELIDVRRLLTQMKEASLVQRRIQTEEDEKDAPSTKNTRPHHVRELNALVPLKSGQMKKQIAKQLRGIVPVRVAVPHPSYQPQKEFVPRIGRQNWSPIFMQGIVPVRGDKTCVPGKKCACGVDGIATAGDRWRVIRRLDDDVFLIHFF
jgi:hypothetical protein